MKNVCIIGGGNIGSALAAIISRQPDVELTVCTQKASKWSDKLLVEDLVTGEQFASGPICAVSNYAEALKSAQIVLITHPSFMTEKTLREIAPLLKIGAWVGFIPGTGGVEFYAHKLLPVSCTLFGLDRVPVIARVKEPGHSVGISLKPQVRAAAIPSSMTQTVCAELEELMMVRCKPLKSFLTVTLTPSNPILHTARLYSLFAGRDIRYPYPSQILFYGEWTDDASELLLGCDEELQNICKALPELPLDVVPLSIHYESDSVPALTRKMRSITSWHNLGSPMVEQEDGTYLVDLQSRYFQEDVPYGLCILKGLAELCGVPTHNMDKILRWYERIYGVSYFCGGNFSGPDVVYTAIPQNFGIHTRDMLIDFYC